MNEKAAKRAGVAYEKVYVHPASHASYYPGATPLTLKILFDPKSGRLLGAQAVGGESVDKRIDVLAVALRAGMTVFDLEELELAYAPPFGSAKDPVNYAGFVAANALRGDVAQCHVEHVLNLGRTSSSSMCASRRRWRCDDPGALAIPPSPSSAAAWAISRGKGALVFCQAGMRGYVACRILSQNGFRCRNLSGGYKIVPGQPSRERAAPASAPAYEHDR